jgi:hypothetical protein
MGQILHGSATTTEAVRRAIQNSQTSLRELAGRYGVNPKRCPNGAGAVRLATPAWDRGSLVPPVLSKEEDAP